MRDLQSRSRNHLPMKKIKSTVTYTVPNWNFCNSDNLINGGELSKNVCRFCVKGRCLLYDEQLTISGEFINKVRACCKATAGFASAIDEPAQAPTVPPRELMKQTIDLYNKTVKDLMAQGYPKQIADNVAKQYVLGSK